MAAPIKIVVELDPKDVGQAGRKIKSALDRELNAGTDTAGAAGQKIGNALFSNVKVNLEKIGPLAKQTGTALTAGVTLPILGIGAAAIKIGFDFEKSMNELVAATKPTNEQLARATALAKQLGNDLSLPAISANDAAAAMTTLAKAGLTLDQSMQAVKGSLQLATAAGIDSAKAAEIQADAINTFKLSAADAGRVADLLSASANSTSGEITDVAAALKQAGAAASLLNIPIEETVTALGLLAQAGVRGSDAGTSLKTALVQLASPSSAAQKTMTSLGLSFFDAQGKLKPLRELVADYTKKTADLTDQQKIETATTLAGTDGFRTLALVLGAGTEAYDKIKKATTEAGAAQQLAAAKAQGGIGAYEAFKSSLETLGLTIFDIVKGPLIALLQILNQVINFVGSLPQSVQTAIVIFSALAAGIGPLLVVLGSVISAITTIAGLFGATLTVTLSGFLSVLLPVIAVLAALAAGAVALYAAWKTNFLGIRDIASQAFAGISAFVQTQFAAIKKQFDDILPLLKQTTATALAAIQKFWADHGQQIIGIVKTYWESVKAIISGAITIIGNSIKLVLAIINGDWKAAWEAAKAIISTAFSAIFTVIKNATSIILQAIKFLASVMLDAMLFLPKKTLEIGGQIIQGLVNGISNGAQFVYAKIKEIAVGALSAARTALGISSPSKEMQIIGEFVGEGFVVGLSKSQGSVEKAIRKLVGENLKAAKDEALDVAAELATILGKTNKDFQFDAAQAKTKGLIADLKELADIRQQLGFNDGGVADRTNLGVDSALAKARIDKRIASGQKSALDLSLPNIDFGNPIGDQIKQASDLDAKLSDLAAQFQLTKAATSNYERAVQSLNTELSGASQEDKDFILNLAKQKDAYEAANKQAEVAKQNIAKITDVFNQAFRDGFDKGPKAFFARIFQAGKETFSRLAASALATLTTNILGGFLNKLSGIFSSGASSGNGSSGGGIGGLLGGVVGGGSSGGGIGGLLGKLLGIGGTGGFAGGAGGSSGGFLGGLLSKFTGGGISAAPSISSGGGILAGIKSSPALGLGGVGSFSLKSLFSGIGFGKTPGSAAGGFGAALPLLGLSLGSKAGGNSLLGQILGGAGGLAVGVGLTAAPAIFGAGGALASPALAALFSNPFTAIAGAGLLVGAVLLGKAKQRKADEKLVDTYWVEYMNTTKDLTTKVNGDQIEGAQALQEALAARSEAISLISQIKTKSVRESRLAHQIPDVDRLFLEPLKAAIEEQKKRAKTIKNIIPEFATGGIVPGRDMGFDSVLAMLRPREVILTQAQQARVRAMAGDDIFGRAGVPGFGSPNSALQRNGLPAYAFGGIVTRPVAPASGGVVVIETLSVELIAGTDTQTRFFVNGGNTTDGRKVVANNYKQSRREREV